MTSTVRWFVTYLSKWLGQEISTHDPRLDTCLRGTGLWWRRQLSLSTPDWFWENRPALLNARFIISLKALWPWIPPALRQQDSWCHQYSSTTMSWRHLCWWHIVKLGRWDMPFPTLPLPRPVVWPAGRLLHIIGLVEFPRLLMERYGGKHQHVERQRWRSSKQDGIVSWIQEHLR